MSENEQRLLEWLGQEDYSQYGECYGTALDSLIAAGLVHVHGSGEHQNFIAKGNDLMFRAVSLTPSGRAALSQDADK